MPPLANHREDWIASHSAIAIFIIAGMLAAWTARYIFRDPRTAIEVLVIAVAIASVPLGMELMREMLKGNFSVDVLAALSVASAIAFKEYWVAAIVLLMLSGGKALEEYATRRASSVLTALARRMPQIAHRIARDNSVSDITTESITVGEKLSVYPHELCPVDGVVISGNGTMDESYLTGEPFLIAKAPGATVLSGAINGDAVLTIQATRRAAESRYAKIVEVLRDSEKSRPKIRRLGERLGAWYTPLAIAIALLSWALSGEPGRFLAVLVIATPCPLLLAIPVAIIGAVSLAARRGIVIKDPSILEKVDSCRTLIVDKTGTLTYGKPCLTDVVCTGKWPKRSVLQFTASLERYSKHPLGAAVLEAAKNEEIELPLAEDVFELPGRGISAHVEGHIVMITGRGKLPAHLLKQLSDVSPGLECVILVDGELAGLMRFHDEPRIETKPFLKHVESRHGIQNTVLLSGDRPSEVARFSASVGITRMYSGKSPEEKVAIVREQTAKARTLYLGDGINDAPAMLNATAGVALGVNSDITAEAAGAVILQSSLQSVDELIHIGSRMKRIALTSAIGGMGLSAIGMGASALGYLAPIEGAILQEVIDLLAILNSLRMILPVKSIGDFSATEAPAPAARPQHAAPVPLAR